MTEQEQLVATSRLNQTGGSGTTTVPKAIMNELAVDEDGLDIAWFTDGQRFFFVPQDQVRVAESND